MSHKVNWFITDQNVTVNYQGQTHIVKRTDPLANDLIRAIKENRMAEIPNLVSIAASMANKSKGNVVIKDGELLVKGVRVPVELARKIQKFIDEGLPYQPLVKFAENLQNNPSYRSVNELFQFLEKNDHPFTENGYFIAYKRVRGNFKDIHSGTFDNTVGTTVEMPRNSVNEDPNQTCSYGLHVANWNYAHTQFASHDPSSDIMLEVEVNPADVVAVPTDYNQSKMRVCKYKVLGVVETEFDGGSLRITDPSYSFPVEDEEEEMEEEEENTCLDCGVVTDEGYELCVDCEVEREEEEDRLQSEEDRYPFEDELDD